MKQYLQLLGGGCLFCQTAATNQIGVLRGGNQGKQSATPGFIQAQTQFKTIFQNGQTNLQHLPIPALSLTARP